MFLDTLTWFSNEGYKDVVPPDECPDPIVVLKNDDTENNTDDPIDPSVECKMGEKTYYFSNEPQKPNESNSVYDNNNQFVNAMLDNTAPTMLMYGGSYLRSHEVSLEDAFPMQFPFGLGSPNHQGIKRRVAVSFEECLVYKPKNTVMKILIFHRKQFLEKLRYQNTVFTYHEYCE